MKNILRVIFFSVVFFLLNNNSTIAQEYNFINLTRDIKLIKTLNFIATTSETHITETLMGNNSSNQPIKIAFRDLSLMNYSYRNYDALTCMDKKNNLYILIDIKHKNAPIEALVALLSHEIVHDDMFSSINEEIFAWTQEAKSWIKMKKINPELANLDENLYPLVKRLNYIEKLYESGENTSKYIAEEILANSAYKNLAISSSGY